MQKFLANNLNRQPIKIVLVVSESDHLNHCLYQVDGETIIQWLKGKCYWHISSSLGLMAYKRWHSL